MPEHRTLRLNPVAFLPVIPCIMGSFRNVPRFNIQSPDVITPFLYAASYALRFIDSTDKQNIKIVVIRSGKIIKYFNLIFC